MTKRGAACIIAIACQCPAQFANAADATRVTATPIEHLIVVVGENISFDNLFATYEPPAGERVANLLSRGIVDRDGKTLSFFQAVEAESTAEITGEPAVPIRQGPGDRVSSPRFSIVASLGRAMRL